MTNNLDWLTIINTAAGIASLVLSIALGGFAIWLSLYFYTKAKDTDKSVSNSLEAIRAQSDALQRMTGRWMDRFTRHATEPRPADEGLMQLVHVVATLPTTILSTLEVVRQPAQPDSAAQRTLMLEAVNGYVGLYYYTALTNVVAQCILPPETDFDPANPIHTATRAIIDRAAADFTHMANTLAAVDQSFVRASSLQQLLSEAINLWRPHVRYTSQAFESARQSQPNPG
jgi:hypothetical protein